MSNIARLNNTIAAVCPILGVSVGTWGDASTVRIDYASSATPNQITAAKSALASFDWSSSADATWLQSQTTTQAVTLASAEDPYAELIRGVLLAILDQINPLRTTLRLATITVAQAKQAVLDKINSGSAN